MSTTLPLFWDLSSNTKSIRIDASIKLIGALEQFQNNFDTPLDSSDSSEEDEEKEKRDVPVPEAGSSKAELEKLNAPDVAYSIHRLIRGLASPRESSRLGFAVALTELLSRLSSVTASQVLSLITQYSQIQGSMKGQEERDMLFARLFGVIALTQSGLLFRSTPLTNSSTPQSTFQEFQDAFEILLSLSTKKSFLKEPSFWAVVLCLRTLDSFTVEWKEATFSHVVEKLFVQDKSWSPEKVAVLLVLQNLNVKADWKTLLSPTFKNEDVLSLTNLNTLAKILKEANQEGDSHSSGQTNWKPQLHFVWDIILDIYFPPENTQSRISHKASFPEFFKIVVDESLLSMTSSDGRKLWGFELFRLSLSRVPPSDLPRLFTPNFMRSWVNHLSKPDRYLHKAAKLVASALPPVVTSNPTIGFPVLLQLLRTHGQFDRLTRTKTVESLLGAMDLTGVEQYIQHLIELAQKPVTQDDNEDPTSIRIWISDQFLMLIRNSSIPQKDVWITNAINFLLLHGLYTMREKDDKSPNCSLHHLPTPAFSDEARHAYRSRLLSSLAELASRHSVIKNNGKSVRCIGCASDGQLWVSKIMEQFVFLEQDSKHVTRIKLPKSNPDEDAQLKHKTLKALGSLAAVSSDQKDVKDGCHLLLSATLLHHFLNEDINNAEDIEICITNIEQLFPRKSSPKKKKQQTSEEPEPTPVAALVDTLIGYLDKSTSFLRTIANQAFNLLSSLVDRESIDLILTQLERRDPAEEEDEDEDEELMEVDESADEEKDSNADGDSESDTEDDPELRKKIEEAFVNSGLNIDSRDSDVSDSSSGEDMDDEQMFQLDEQLAMIFRSRTKGKGGTGAQREATHFKNRVLDLVDIYLRKESTNPQTPIFILPLVRVLLDASADEKQLSDKVASIIRGRYGKARDVPSSPDMSLVESTLEELHAIARKSPTTNVKDIILICNSYLVRVCFSVSSHDASFVYRTYLASLRDFATRKTSPLHPNFFHEIFRRYPTIVWTSRKELLDLIQNAANGFRKAQLFNTLLPIFNQFSALDADQSALIEFIKEFKSVFQTTILEACETDSLNPAQMKEVFKSCLSVARQTKRIIEDETQLRNAWGDTSFESLKEKLQSSKFKTMTALTNILRQISSLFTSQSSDTMEKKKNGKKRKAEDPKESEPKHKRKKKAKKTAEA